MQKAFDVMDANKDGFVTKDELKNLLKGLGEDVTDEVVDEMITIADTNGDGKVEFDEFCNASMAGNWAADRRWFSAPPRLQTEMH